MKSGPGQVRFRNSCARISLLSAVIRAFLILATAVPLSAQPQSPGALLADSLSSSIEGTVKDSLGLPVLGASILIAPGGWIFRTDSAGKFFARRLPSGALTISVRRLGFAPLHSQIVVRAGEQLALNLAMQRIPQTLAEVEVRAVRECPRYSIDGVLCRRESGMGFFMNRQEILAKNVAYPMLLLRDVEGFRQNLNGSPRTVESTVGWRCMRTVIDGGFRYSSSPIRRPSDVYAIEVYQPPDIPPEYQHLYWDVSRNQKYHNPCTLVVMWSMQEAQRFLRRPPPERK